MEAEFRVLNPGPPGPPEPCQTGSGAFACNRGGIGCPLRHEDYVTAERNWGEVLRLRALEDSGRPDVGRWWFKERGAVSGVDPSS